MGGTASIYPWPRPVPPGFTVYLSPILRACSLMLVLVWLAGGIQHSGTHRHVRKTIPLPLSSTKARLEDFKKNFSLETTAKYTQQDK